MCDFCRDIIQIIKRDLLLDLHDLLLISSEIVQIRIHKFNTKAVQKTFTALPRLCSAGYNAFNQFFCKFLIVDDHDIPAICKKVHPYLFSKYITELWNMKVSADAFLLRLHLAELDIVQIDIPLIGNACNFQCLQRSIRG